MNNDAPAPLCILIAALGGEGGGVLMNWIIAAAHGAGYAAQSTSVPGVAQRTGSTSYYIEIAPHTGSDAVFSLVPLPGRVDVVLASELVEAGRMIAAGFVSPARTTLISSTSRVITTAEKIHLGDGRFDAANIEQAAAEMARRSCLLDLHRLASENGTFISATMLGALAGSGVLPWPQDVCLAAIGEGAAASASRNGFLAASRAAKNSAGTAAMQSLDAAPDTTAATPNTPAIADLPHPIQTVVANGHDRVCDFQDAEYGASYLDRVARMAAVADPAQADTGQALAEASRRLALWMAYEDVARVADLKTRPERFARIRREAEAKPGQLVLVSEYLKPRAEEIADIMPVAVGRWILRRVRDGKGLPGLGKGLLLRSDTITGFYLLRAVAALRRIRRRSYRFQVEQREIEQWLDAMITALPRSAGFAGALAELPRVLKGYSDTYLRGRTAYNRILTEIVRPALASGSENRHAARLREAIAAALADEEHAALERVLGEHNDGQATVNQTDAHAHAD